MSKLTVVLASLLSLILVGCASQPKNNQNHARIATSEKVEMKVKEEGKVRIASDDSDLDCETYQRTGSHRLHKYCMTKAEKKDKHDSMLRNVNKIKRHSRINPATIPGQ